MTGSRGDDDEWRTKRVALDVLLDHLLHDLKQPLSLIRIVAQDLRLDVRRDRLDVASLPGSMKTVETAIDELTAQLDQLRVFMKVSNPPSAQTDETSTSVNVIGRAVVARAREVWAGQVEIAERFALELPAVGIDPHRLEMVLWELVKNAVSADRPTGGATCRLRMSTELRDPMVVVSVEDDAAGVPEAIRSSIFEPFFTTHPGAPGLGLALARKLAQGAGGELELRDSGGHGALFELRLKVKIESSS